MLKYVTSSRFNNLKTSFKEIVLTFIISQLVKFCSLGFIIPENVGVRSIEKLTVYPDPTYTARLSIIDLLLFLNFFEKFLLGLKRIPF